MEANVVLHHLGHQAVHGAAHRGDDLQHVGAADLGFERALDGFDLTADTPHPGQKLRFFANSVGHVFTSLGCRAPQLT